MLLIVNADDLGSSESINHAIFELMEAGTVTSATIMANGPAFDHAARHVRRFPSCSFGVHLNLTEFEPLSGPEGLTSILRHSAFCRELLTRRTALTLRRQLERELLAQVQRVVDAGIQPTHLDSHHFIHLRAELFPVIKAVQKHFGIRRLRSPRQAISKMGAGKTLRERLMEIAMRKMYPSAIPDGWCEFRTFYSALAADSLPRFQCLELMVHPGSQQNAFAVETGLLRSNWQQRLPDGVHLASYHLLAA